MHGIDEKRENEVYNTAPHAVVPPAAAHLAHPEGAIGELRARRCRLQPAPPAPAAWRGRQPACWPSATASAPSQPAEQLGGPGLTRSPMLRFPSLPSPAGLTGGPLFSPSPPLPSPAVHKVEHMAEATAMFHLDTVSAGARLLRLAAPAGPAGGSGASSAAALRTPGLARHCPPSCTPRLLFWMLQGATAEDVPSNDDIFLLPLWMVSPGAAAPACALARPRPRRLPACRRHSHLLLRHPSIPACSAWWCAPCMSASSASSPLSCPSSAVRL